MIETPKVTIIEDSESSYRTLRALLHKKYQVNWVNCNNLNFEIVPDLFLVDLGLPDQEIGFSVLEKIHRQFPKVPIIIVSGFGDAKTAIRAMRTGAVDYIQKPVDPDIFLETVSNTIEKF